MSEQRPHLTLTRYNYKQSRGKPDPTGRLDQWEMPLSWTKSAYTIIGAPSLEAEDNPLIFSVFTNIHHPDYRQKAKELGEIFLGALQRAMSTSEFDEQMSFTTWDWEGRKEFIKSVFYNLASSVENHDDHFHETYFEYTTVEDLDGLANWKQREGAKVYYSESTSARVVLEDEELEQEGSGSGTGIVRGDPSVDEISDGNGNGSGSVHGYMNDDDMDENDEVEDSNLNENGDEDEYLDAIENEKTPKGNSSGSGNLYRRWL